MVNPCLCLQSLAEQRIASSHNSPYLTLASKRGTYDTGRCLRPAQGMRGVAGGLEGWAMNPRWALPYHFPPKGVLGISPIHPLFT